MGFFLCSSPSLYEAVFPSAFCQSELAVFSGGGIYILLCTIPVFVIHRPNSAFQVVSGMNMLLTQVTLLFVCTAYLCGTVWCSISSHSPNHHIIIPHAAKAVNKVGQMPELFQHIIRNLLHKDAQDVLLLDIGRESARSTEGWYIKH